MTLTPFQQQLVVLGYYVLLIVIAAFILRNVCGLFRTELPSWRRAIVMVLLVGPLAYLAFDFSAFVIMLSMQDVLIYVPPGYSYGQWFHVPFGLKWQILNLMPVVRILPFVFAICVAGALQVILLQLQVPFRIAVVMLAVQGVATLVAAVLLGYAFHFGLMAVGWAMPQQEAVAQAPTWNTGQPGAGPQHPAVQKKESGPTVSEYLQNAREKLGTHFEPYIQEVDEACKPVTKYLPEFVQGWLAHGGWWWVLAVAGVIGLLWLHSIVSRLTRALFRPLKRKKKRKSRTRKLAVDLREDLGNLGEEGFTDEGDLMITVKGMPARLRLMVIAAGGRDAGHLDDEMAGPLMDWIRPGLSKVVASDYPRIRLWPPFMSSEGFARSFAANMLIPEEKGSRSHWVLVSGTTVMGRQKLQVGLVLYTVEPNTLHNVRVPGEQWLDVLGTKQLAAVSRR